MSFVTTLLWVTLFSCLIQGILLHKCDKSKKLPKLPCLRKTFDIMDTSHDCTLGLKEFTGIFYDKFTHGQYIRKETFKEAVNYKNFMNCGIDAQKLFDYICKATGYTDNIPMNIFINCFDQDRDGVITGVDFTYKFHQLEQLTPQGQEFVYIAIEKDPLSVVIHGSTKGKLYLERDTAFIRHFWQFCFSPDENKETTVHNNNKAKKVKLRENQPSTKVTKRSRGRPHKHPIHNNETSTIAKDEESYENDTSFTSGNVKPSIHSLMCIDGDAFKSRIETNENIQTLNPEKTDEIECRANQTECGTKKTEYDAPKRKCGANKRKFRTKKICGAKKRKCVPKKIHFVECAVEKRECGFEKIECGAKNIECGLEKIEYGAKNIECGFEKIEYGIEETECDEDSGLHTAEETEYDEDSGLHTFLDNSFEEECELILPTCSPDLPIRDNIEGEAGVKPTAHLDQVNDITPKFDGNDVRIGTGDQIQSIENSKILETGKNNSEPKLKKTLLPKITESWEFQCRICFHVFSSKHALKCHNKIHLPGYQKPKEKCEKKGQKFECSECDREFSSEGRLKRHIELKPHEPVKCDSCDIIFPNREKYKIHVNNCHLEKDVTYQCEDCGKVFKKKGTLRKHQNFIHKNIHAYTCTICNLQFKYCKSFKAHTRIYHSAGDSPKVVCDICGGQFTTDQNLQRHMKIHNNDMRFACPHCPKTFVQKHGLTCHLRIHTGSKPYSCDICKEGFAHNVSLKNHRRKYHMNVPVIFPEKTEDLSYQE